MPSPLADSITAQIKRAVPIVDLIGEHVALTRRGRTFKGLCPFHDDHNPSFDVDPERQYYRCWSCGAKGDIFDFLMGRERIGFREALVALAQRARINLPSDHARPRDSGKDLVYEVNRWAESEFHDCLLKSELATNARSYVSDRGIELESVRAFRLGFVPRDWEWLIQRARQKRFTPEMLERAGLAKPRERGSGMIDRFRGRLMFPIHDARGRVIAFGGRILPEYEADEPAKYLNSSETAIFTKHEHLYGLDQARDALTKCRTAIVVEGYTDCIMAHQLGLKHTVGTLGTALGESHIAILKRYADRIVLVFDGDEAGQKAADRALALFLRHEVDLRIFCPPDGLDPCDYLLKHGADQFRRGLDSAVDALDFKLHRAGQLHDLTSLAGRRHALDYVLSAIAAVPVAATGTAPVTREIVLDKLSHRLGITHEAVRRRLREVREQQSRARSDRSPQVASDVHTPSLWANETPHERELMEVVLAEPSRFGDIAQYVTAEHLRAPGNRRIFEACSELDREAMAWDLDSLRLRLEDRELACRASVLAETGREKGAVDRRRADILHFFQSQQEADAPVEWMRGDAQEGDPLKFLAHKQQQALSRQRKTQRHALSDSP